MKRGKRGKERIGEKIKRKKGRDIRGKNRRRGENDRMIEK